MKIQEDFLAERKWMVTHQIRNRQVFDERLLNAFLKIPRHKFVPEASQKSAYEDRPLSIGMGQTISQPYIVALMISLLNISLGDNVLEIGTGSGYQTAILAQLAKKVYSIERLAPLAERAQSILNEIGISNVVIQKGDGTSGWQTDIDKNSDSQNYDISKFDGIIVSAAAPHIPNVLTEQLSEGGRLIIPIGSRFRQELIKITLKNGKIRKENFGGCMFVPLIGENGWKS